MLKVKNDKIMKYRVLALMGVLALAAGTVMQAQDFDDIYYDASKSANGTTKVKVTKPVKTAATYGEVPDKYKVAAQGNYQVERDEDEYNRHVAYDAANEPAFEVDINGDTIYEYEDAAAFANTRRIERFYNPDIVILSDDDDLVELYYDESPTINLVVGSDLGYTASYGWGTSYYPWYTGWYEPWYTGWYGYYSPWYAGWHDPWAYSYYGWYSPWYHHWHGPSLWGWNYWGIRPWHHGMWAGYGYGGWHGWDDHRPNVSVPGRHYKENRGVLDRGGRVGLASNRNNNKRVDGMNTSRNKAISTPSGTSRNTGGSRVRGGYATTRTGSNVGSSRPSGVSTRPSSSGSVSSRPSSVGSVSRPSSSGSVSRPSSSGSVSRPSSSGGSRPSGGGSSRPSGGGGGGSHGGSSGGGSHRH